MTNIEIVGKLNINAHDLCCRVYSVDSIAPTLNTCSGGYQEAKVFNEYNLSVRKLTPTEYGRLQAFPMDNWKQVVSDRQAYKQFGNAVTTTIVTAIAKNIKKTLDVSQKPVN